MKVACMRVQKCVNFAIPASSFKAPGDGSDGSHPAQQQLKWETSATATSDKPIPQGAEAAASGNGREQKLEKRQLIKTKLTGLGSTLTGFN